MEINIGENDNAIIDHMAYDIIYDTAQKLRSLRKEFKHKALSRAHDLKTGIASKVDEKTQNVKELKTKAINKAKNSLEVFEKRRQRLREQYKQRMEKLKNYK